MYVIGDEEVEAVRRVIESGQLFRYRGGEGGETDQFETAWAKKIGASYCIAVTSGTAALTCALAGMGVGPGDEAIVPGYTWIATALSVLSVGAIPIIAEVDESLTLDPTDVERKITARTKVIIPVHICGFPADLETLGAIAKRHNLCILEDACQADGGSYHGHRLGSIGRAGAHSFNHFKIITCGEGGAMVTSDRTVYERALVYHDVGSAFRAYADPLTAPVFAGTNFRMNEILGAVLRVQVSRLDGILETLRAEKRRLVEVLLKQSKCAVNRSNDPDGDCGTTLPLLFESRSAALAFLEGMKAEGYGLSSPIDSGPHVYRNWKPILEKRGAHHPQRDPYRCCGYDVSYSPDMCPKTLDYLERTVYVTTSVTRTEEELKGLIAALKKVAGHGATRDARV